MAKEGVPAKREKRELAIPQIEPDDIVTLIDAKKGLKTLWNRTEEYGKAVKKSVKGATKRIEKGLLFKREYEYIDGDYFRRYQDELQDTIFKEFFPLKELELINPYWAFHNYDDDSIGIRRISKQLANISEENNIFLRYFFLTPVNKAYWERFFREVVPVTEETSVLFGLYSEKRAKPFEKSGHEKGHSEIENMQMIPSVLKEEHIDFYINRIFDATQKYNTEIKRFAQMLHKFREEEKPLEGHFEMDVKIMNYCLGKISERPYSPAMGAFAIQLDTATSRVLKELKKITKELNDTAAELLRVKIRPPLDERYHDLSHLGLSGFKFVEDGPGNRPRYAIRRI